MRIGEVAERTSLSLRTIRYYEEVGLVRPSARSQGGFRLYTEDDVERLLVVRRMKPLDFTLDEMRGLLEALDALAHDAVPAEERPALLDRVAAYRAAAAARIQALRDQLDTAERFAEELREHATRSRPSGALAG